MNNLERRRLERVALLESVPWVRRLVRPQRCTGIKWSKVPRKAIYRMYGREPAEITDDARCRNRAHWRFRALKYSGARSDVYCTVHLVYHCLYYNRSEADRLERWLRRRESRVA